MALKIAMLKNVAPVVTSTSMSCWSTTRPMRSSAAVFDDDLRVGDVRYGHVCDTVVVDYDSAGHGTFDARDGGGVEAGVDDAVASSAYAELARPVTPAKAAALLTAPIKSLRAISTMVCLLDRISTAATQTKTQFSGQHHHNGW